MATPPQRSNPKSSSATTVLMTICSNQRAMLDRDVPELHASLTFTRRFTVPGAKTGWLETCDEFGAWDIDDCGRLTFTAGIAWLVQRRLGELGYRVRVVDRRTDRDEFFRDEELVENITDDKSLDLLAAIQSNRLGQMELPSDILVHDWLLLIARAYPKARIGIVAPASREARKLRFRLSERLGQGEYVRDVESGRRVRRIKVVTVQSLGAFATREWDMLLLVDGERSVGQKIFDQLVHVKYRRLYAFIQPQRRSDRLNSIRLEMVAGPVVLPASKPRAEVRVQFVDTRTMPVKAFGDRLKEKRELYWHNPSRNRLIADIAENVMRLRVPELREAGFADRAIEIVERHPLKAIILVENTKHAQELRDLLPSWGQGDMCPSELTPDAELADRTPNALIVTEAYAATYPIVADVIIRATGTPWPLQMKRFPPVQREDRPNVLIIDFADTFNSIAAEDSRKRKASYVRDGYEIVSCTKETGKRSLCIPSSGGNS